MAAAYSIVFVRSGSQVVGGSRVVPVRVTGFNTHAVDSDGMPVDIYAELRLDLSLIDATQIGPIIDNVAQSIQIIAGRADVAGMIYIQDVNRAGQLVDIMEITVQSSAGDAADTFPWPLTQLNEFVLGPIIQQHVDRLDALLAL